MLSRVLSLIVVAAIASPLVAADKDKNLKGGLKGDAAGLKVPKGIDLAAEQQARLKAINDSIAPKLAEVQKQVDAIITPERKAAQAEAMKKAKAEGKDKKGIVEAGQAALNLKDDEAAKLKELGKARGAILQEAQQQLLALLTDEQKAKLNELKKGKGEDKNKKPKGDKPLKGAQPSKGDKPLKGARPDPRDKPLKGAQPSKGDKPLKGAQPNKNLQPSGK